MLFSILITSFNQADTIVQTLKSCLNQTFDDYEIVISDDCSQDNIVDVIRSFSSNKIRFYQQEVNLKEYPNRNFLIKKAKGDFVIFIDAEDIIYPHALSTLSYYVTKFSDCGLITMLETSVKKIYPIKLTPNDFFKFEFLSSSPITGRDFTTMVFNRKALIDIGLLPTEIKSGDTYIQIKLAQKYPTLLLADGLTWWRCSSGNVTTKLTREYSASDYSHLASVLNYRVSLLDNLDCPLDFNDVIVAKENLYGSTLRYLFRFFIRLQWRKIFFFTIKSKVPYRFWYTILKPFHFKYFTEYNNDNPLFQEFN